MTRRNLTMGKSIKQRHLRGQALDPGLLQPSKSFRPPNHFYRTISLAVGGLEGRKL